MKSFTAACFSLIVGFIVVAALARIAHPPLKLLPDRDSAPSVIGRANIQVSMSSAVAVPEVQRQTGRVIFNKDIVIDATKGPKFEACRLHLMNQGLGAVIYCDTIEEISRKGL
jgi:hypothetical protein